MKKALIIVDVQNDFCSGGGYPVPRGDEIVKVLNGVLACARHRGWKVFASRDWHSAKLFTKNDDKKHCIQNTKGAEFHPNLNIGDDVVIISKGADDLGKRHYSAFNGDEINLYKLLEKERVGEVYIGGLALNYCVKNTALDSVKNGFITHVILDATRAVNIEPGEYGDLIKDLENKGVRFINSKDMVKGQLY